MTISKDIKALLQNESLCSLATCADNKPYLSLMNFTYVADENRIILSSRKNTKKYSNIVKNKNISLLVFSSANNLSATFLGTAKLMIGEEASHYRKMHLNESNMPQFILGENKALIVFSIEKIVVSDNRDDAKYVYKEDIEE